MNRLDLNQIIEDRFDHLKGQAAKILSLPYGQLEYGTLQMLQQNRQIIRINQGIFDRFLVEVFRVVDQVLILRVRRCHQDSQGGVLLPAGTT